MERYQILLDKDPRSQVFAPLAEAYRKMGLVEEAFRLCVRGVQYNPNFAGGRIALAKVLLDRDNAPGAQKELEKAIEISPDNILAHQMLGELYLKGKNAKEALRSYKMVLFLAPNNERAQTAVKKLESLTADEFEEEIFAMKPLKNVKDFEAQLDELTPLKESQPGSTKINELDRFLSLADAYIVRNDFERARDTLTEAQVYYAQNAELQKRIKLLVGRSGLNVAEPKPVEKPPSREQQRIDQKIEMLSELLHRVQTRI